MESEIILLSGTSNLPLAQRVAGRLRIALGQLEITRFIDNECRVYVKENVEGKNIFVLQALSQIADQNLVELCLIGQALKCLKANKITAVIPWMGYSKQDKAFRRGEAVSAQLVAKFIEAAGFDSVITVELHSENLLPFFHIPVKEISTHELFAKFLQRNRKEEKIMVVSPDAGGASRSEKFAREIDLPVIYIEKKRDLLSGKVSIKNISQSVAGVDIVIFDDIINTGETAIKVSEFLKKSSCGRIHFLATHAVLAGQASLKLAQSAIDSVTVTDTIIIPGDKMFSKLNILSVSPLVAHAISQTIT